MVTEASNTNDKVMSLVKLAQVKNLSDVETQAVLKLKATQSYKMQVIGFIGDIKLYGEVEALKIHKAIAGKYYAQYKKFLKEDKGYSGDDQNISTSKKSASKLYKAINTSRRIAE